MAQGQSDPLSVHHFTLRGLISRWAPYWLLFAVFGLIAIGLLALALARPQSGTLLPALLCLVIAVGCLAPPLVAFLGRPRRAEVYPDRLVWRTGAGELQASWDLVASVHRFERLTNNWWYQTALTLTLADGSKVVFDHSLSEFADLANNVQQQMAQHMLPKKEAELRAGALDFGPISLRTDGISHGGAFHRWQDIEYSVSGGYLIVVPSGDQFGWGDRKEVALAEIPNSLVLLGLMAHVGKAPVAPGMVVPKQDRGRVNLRC
jgi:hypothetical protein